MRNVAKISLALLITALAVGFPSSAPATTPVVDQYTEQLPSPGGPEPAAENPGSPGKPAGNDSNLAGFNAETAAGGATPTGSDASNGSTDAAASKNQPDKADMANGVEPSAEGTDNSLGAAATSGSDGDGEGMGWTFPVALVLIATVIAGIAVVRRHRGNLAT